MSGLVAALTQPAVLDAFADALTRRQSERDEAARAEVAHLAQQLAPARAQLAASMAVHTTGGH